MVHVFAPAGGRITELKIRPWQRVEKGQTLALLQSSDLARAVADYHTAPSRTIEVKQKQLARAHDLLAHHAIAEKDFQQAQADSQIGESSAGRGPRTNSCSSEWILTKPAHSCALQRRAPA